MLLLFRSQQQVAKSPNSGRATWSDRRRESSFQSWDICDFWPYEIASQFFLLHRDFFEACLSLEESSGMRWHRWVWTLLTPPVLGALCQVFEWNCSSLFSGVGGLSSRLLQQLFKLQPTARTRSLCFAHRPRPPPSWRGEERDREGYCHLRQQYNRRSLSLQKPSEPVFLLSHLFDHVECN